MSLLLFSGHHLNRFPDHRADDSLQEERNNNKSHDSHYRVPPPYIPSELSTLFSKTQQVPTLASTPIAPRCYFIRSSLRSKNTRRVNPRWIYPRQPDFIYVRYHSDISSSPLLFAQRLQNLSKTTPVSKSPTNKSTTDVNPHPSRGLPHPPLPRIPPPHISLVYTIQPRPLGLPTLSRPIPASNKGSGCCYCFHTARFYIPRDGPPLVC